MPMPSISSLRTSSPEVIALCCSNWMASDVCAIGTTRAVPIIAHHTLAHDLQAIQFSILLTQALTQFFLTAISFIARQASGLVALLHPSIQFHIAVLQALDLLREHFYNVFPANL